MKKIIFHIGIVAQHSQFNLLSVPFMLAEFNEVFVKPKFQIRERYELSPSRASLTARSAHELSVMPTWPGTQTNTISFSSQIKSKNS